MQKRILIFGDSIVYGAWDSKGGWVDRLKREAHKMYIETQGETKIQVLNCGIGGETSKGLLKRFETELTSRVGSWPITVVIAIGTNDGRRVNGEIEVLVEEFRKNVSDIIAIAKKHTNDDVFVIGIPGIEQETVTFKGMEYRRSVLFEYDNVLQQISQGVATYISTREVFENEKGLMSFDGVHPNDKGHKVLYSLIGQKVIIS